MATCSFLACPVPTTAFLTIIGKYSVTGSAISAGVSSAIPRAMPSLSVEAGFLLAKLVSTAASSGPCAASTAASASCNWTRRSASGRVRVRGHDAVGQVAEPVAPGLDDAPAGAPQARIKSDDAHGPPLALAYSNSALYSGSSQSLSLSQSQSQSPCHVSLKPSAGP